MNNWTQTCANLAAEHCPKCIPPTTCGTSSTGDCCDANGSPFCNDEACCESVCNIDPYCCDTEGGEWDACCAELAAETCPHPDWPDQGICDPPPMCAPGNGECCAANGTPGCEDPECCQTVCDLDTFCCDVAWDQICADGAQKFCPLHCDTLNKFASCSEEGACGNNGFDCSCDEWCFHGGNCCPDVCEHCSSTPGCNPADLTGDNIVRVTDLLLLLEQWGECPQPPPEEHCPDPIPCPADFNDDGSVSVADMLFMLNNWGGEPVPTSLCQGNCGNFISFGCWCDEMCFETGDCCGDICEYCNFPACDS